MISQQAQETGFFFLIYAIVTVVLLLSFLSLLAFEYRRWITFMNKQRQYFKRLANTKLREKRREEEIRQKRMEFLATLKGVRPEDIPSQVQL